MKTSGNETGDNRFTRLGQKTGAIPTTHRGRIPEETTVRNGEAHGRFKTQKNPRHFTRNQEHTGVKRGDWKDGREIQNQGDPNHLHP